jgi:2-polyprenyl-3-methyl-5-hydroxy-6-metoxy-1,4-benzoquinol methylase
MLHPEWSHFLKDFEVAIILEILEKEVGNEAIVLEIGGGDGYTASKISQKGYRVISIDPSPRRPSYYNVEKMSAENLIGYPNNKSDVVFSSNVLEHIENLGEALSEMKRVLKPNGIMIHSVPTPACTFATMLAQPISYFRSIVLSLKDKVSVDVKRETLDKIPFKIKDNKKVLIIKIVKLLRTLNPINIFWGSGHGASKSRLRSLWIWRRSYWKNIFNMNGLSVKSIYTVPFFMSMHKIFPGKFLGIRKYLGKHGLQVDDIYVLMISNGVHQNYKTPISKFFLSPRKNWKPLSKVQKEGVRIFKKMVALGELKYETIPCPLCKGFSYQLLSQVDKYGIDQDVVICKECGFVYNNPRLTEESYIKFYDTIYRQIYMGYEKPVNEYFIEQYELRGKRHAGYIQDKLKMDFEGKLVVEIGCGAGGILQRFKELGADSIGFDHDSKYIDFGKNGYGLELYAKDFREHKFNSHPDIIILSNVLEHLVDYQSKLAPIKELMSEDSILFIEVPSLKRRRFGWLLQLAHVSYFTDHTLSYSLESLGFEILDLCYYNTSINCLAKLSTSRIEKTLESEYTEISNFLVNSEKQGVWAYYEYNWYYPYIIMPINLAIKAIHDPKKALKRISKIIQRK